MHQEAREVRGAEKCRAGPLRREVLRAAGVPNGARGGVRRCGAARMGDAEARAKHRIVCQHGGCAWVQGPGWSHDREHRARLQEEESGVCVWTPRASVRLPSVREQRRHKRADAGW